MADTLTPEQRSRRMALIRGKNTKPELAVRRCLHALGYRYRIHGDKLPGKPDLVLGKHQAVVFVHGCFWHRHAAKGCKLARLPKSRLNFWTEKLETNRLRDKANRGKLKKLGWRSLVIWECQIKNRDALTRRLEKFLARGKS